MRIGNSKDFAFDMLYTTDSKEYGMKKLLTDLYEIKNWKCNGDSKMYAVIEAAIKALETQNAFSAKDANDEDLISRQSAIDAITDLMYVEPFHECNVDPIERDNNCVREECIEALASLPPVIFEGQWLSMTKKLTNKSSISEERMKELLTGVIDLSRTGKEEDAMWRLNHFGFTPQDCRALGFPETATILAHYQESRYNPNIRIRKENGSDEGACLELRRAGQGNRKVTILKGLPNDIAPNEVFSFWLNDKYFAYKLWGRDDIGKILAERGYKATDEQIDTVFKSLSTQKLGICTDCTDEEYEELEKSCAAAKLPNWNWMAQPEGFYTLHSNRDEVNKYNGKVFMIAGESHGVHENPYTDDAVMCILKSINGEEIEAYADELLPCDQKKACEQSIISALQENEIVPTKECVREIYFRASDKGDDINIFIKICAQFIKEVGYDEFCETDDISIYNHSINKEEKE